MIVMEDVETDTDPVAMFERLYGEGGSANDAVMQVLSEIPDWDPRESLVSGRWLARCGKCEDWGFEEDFSEHVDYVDHVCEYCIQHSHRCESCEKYCDDYHYVDSDVLWCEHCIDYNAYWCETCEEYSREEHVHGSECSARMPSFSFPAPGIPGIDTVENDTPFTVTVPGGIVTSDGIRRIQRYLESLDCPEGYNKWSCGSPLRTLWDDSFDWAWQTKEGNLTKRISKLYAKAGHKLTPEQVSQVGNLARDNTPMNQEHTVTLTREFRYAENFVNEGSCWWGCYSNSMCHFKECGGIGLRTWDDAFPVTRSWVMGLASDSDDGILEPLLDPSGAEVFLVFNSYGTKNPREHPQLVANMVGGSYRKVRIWESSMYINGDSGYLVGPQNLIDKFDSNLTLVTDRSCGCENDR